MSQQTSLINSPTTNCHTEFPDVSDFALAIMILLRPLPSGRRSPPGVGRPSPPAGGQQPRSGSGRHPPGNWDLRILLHLTYKENKAKQKNPRVEYFNRYFILFYFDTFLKYLTNIDFDCFFIVHNK